jgi:hypothetical protein
MIAKVDRDSFLFIVHGFSWRLTMRAAGQFERYASY